MSESNRYARIKQRIDALAALNDGHITPRQVVEDARAPSSPLHVEFEWDDQAAAEEHRLSRARSLIRLVRISRVDVPLSLPVIAYVRDPAMPANEQGYVSVLKLRSEPEQARAALREEIKRARSALLRAREVGLVLGLGHDIEAILRALAALSQRVNDEPRGDEARGG